MGFDIAQVLAHGVANSCSPFDLPKGPDGVIFSGTLLQGSSRRGVKHDGERSLAVYMFLLAVAVGYFRS